MDISVEKSTKEFLVPRVIGICVSLEIQLRYCTR